LGLQGQQHTRGYDFVTLYQRTLGSPQFPEDLLKFCNRFSQSDDEELTRDDIMAAGKIIVYKYDPKYKKGKGSKESYRKMSNNIYAFFY
jgi:hypothetical protein